MICKKEFHVIDTIRSTSAKMSSPQYEIVTHNNANIVETHLVIIHFVAKTTLLVSKTQCANRVKYNIHVCYLCV